MVCRNALKDINETWYASCIYRLPDQWAVGLMGCRTNGPSDKWAVGLLGGPLFHDYAEITTTERVGI